VSRVFGHLICSRTARVLRDGAPWSLVAGTNVPATGTRPVVAETPARARTMTPMSENAAGGQDPHRGDASADPWDAQMDALGTFIRTQRQLARLSLREMASLTSVSNAYLSQIERGLHQPSLKVLRSIADALELNTDQLLTQAGWTSTDNGGAPDEGEEPARTAPEVVDTEEAIRRDPRLSDAQRDALIGVYRSFVDGSPG